MNPKVSISMSTSSTESFSPPPPVMRTNQKRRLHSDSSVSRQMNLTPIGLREEQIKEIFSHHTSYTHDDIETTTSRSFVHGVILVSIMISSLIAFICSKVRRCSNFVELSRYEDCSKYFHFYSAMTISSCLITFVIYFLHLIAQCDILCLKRKKYEFEIITISILGSLLLFSSVCYMVHSEPRSESFTFASLILSAVAVLLYLLRLIILGFEMLSQRRHIKRTRKKWRPQRTTSDIVYPGRSISKDRSSLTNSGNTSPPAKVISYVRSSERKKTLSTSASEDFDDDVFIQ